MFLFFIFLVLKIFNLQNLKYGTLYTKKTYFLLQLLKGFQSIRHSYSNLSSEASVKLQKSGMRSKADTSLGKTIKIIKM
jgi:hypothetical protein